MKSSLFSLLAIALTIVGCKNYDDQFENLKGQITDLTAQVADLSQIQRNLDALNLTVTGLATALEELPTQDFEELALGLAEAQTAIDSLTIQLENINVDAPDLNTISSTLAVIAADINALLNTDKVVNSDLIITNPAQLLLAESLVGSQTDTSNVIVSGAVIVSFTETNFDADQRARAQAVLNKIAIIVNGALNVSNTASPSTSIEFPSLTFVDGYVHVGGAEAYLPKLQTVSSYFYINYGGDISFPVLTNIGASFKIDSSKLESITSLDLDRIKINGYIIGSVGTDIKLPNATTVKFGTAIVTAATLDVATEIDIKTDHHVFLVLNAPKATIVNIAAKTSGYMELNTNSTTIINIPNLINGYFLVGESAEIHLNRLEGFRRGTSVSTFGSKKVYMPELTTNVSGTLTFTEATSLHLPKFTLGSGALDAQKAESITFKSGSEANLITTDKLKSLTIVEQDYATNFDTSGLSVLETLTVTGKVNSDPTMAASVTNVVSATGSALKTVNVEGMMDTLFVGGPELTTLSTSGNIRSLTINTAAKLTAPIIGHDHIDGSGAAELIVLYNAELPRVDFSSVSDVGVFHVAHNPKLTSFVPPNKEARVESVASISAVVGANNLEGVYTPGTAVVSATDTTPEIPAMEASIVQASIYALRLWIEAHAETDSNTPTFNIEIDALDSDNDGDADDGDYATVAAADANNTADDGNNQIDTLAELKTVKE